MTHDITHCSGYLCPIAEKCRRHLALLEWEKLPERFPIAIMTADPYDHKTGKCDYFWEINVRL